MVGIHQKEEITDLLGPKVTWGMETKARRGLTASEDREGCEEAEEEEEEGLHLEEVEREGREDWGWWWEGLMGMEWRRTS